MDTKTKQELSIFKFSLIAPVVNGTFNASSKMEYFRDVAKLTHKLPSGKEVKYSSMTIKKWYLKYRKGGLESLEPKTRNDAGVPRVLTDELIERIHAVKNTYPHITGKLVYLKLVEDGHLKSSRVSLSTVLRYIRDNNLKPTQLGASEVKAFEMEYANDCWQADSSVGPRIKIDGVSHKTYMISIIDDASRMITHIEIFLNDNALNVQKVLRKAVAKYGVPKKLYVDNGGPYKNEQLKYICASLGTVLTHHPPFMPICKAKIERSFRTIKDKWMHAINWNDFKSIEELNKSLNEFLVKSYTNSIHSALNQTPRERYLKDGDKIKFIPEELLNFHFLHKISRKVNKDSTILVHKKTFEVPQKYIGTRVNLKFDPTNFNRAFVVDENNKIIEEISLLNKVLNSRIVRKKIDYTKNVEGDINDEV